MEKHTPRLQQIAVEKPSSRKTNDRDEAQHGNAFQLQSVFKLFTNFNTMRVERIRHPTEQEKRKAEVKEKRCSTPFQIDRFLEDETFYNDDRADGRRTGSYGKY